MADSLPVAHGIADTRTKATGIAVAGPVSADVTFADAVSRCVPVAVTNDRQVAGGRSRHKDISPTSTS